MKPQWNESTNQSLVEYFLTEQPLNQLGKVSSHQSWLELDPTNQVDWVNKLSRRRQTMRREWIDRVGGATRYERRGNGNGPQTHDGGHHSATALGGGQLGPD